MSLINVAIKMNHCSVGTLHNLWYQVSSKSVQQTGCCLLQTDRYDKTSSENAPTKSIARAYCHIHLDTKKCKEQMVSLLNVSF
jgi:hypothetical protein